MRNPGRKKLLSEDLITKTLARASGLPYLKIDPLKLDQEVVTSHIPRAFALKNLMVPVGMKNGVVTVAVSDPTTKEAIEELQRTRRIKIDRVLASRSDILKILGEFFGFRASVLAAESEMQKGTGISNLEQYFQMRTVGSTEMEGNDKHIVAAVDFLLQYAFDQRASEDGMATLREAAIRKMLLGETTFEEVVAVTGQCPAWVFCGILSAAKARRRRPNLH